jgi:hypothetical protein
MVFERANDVDHAFAYFESKLIDASNRVKYIFSSTQNMKAEANLAASSQNNKIYVYSTNYGTKINLHQASMHDKNGKILELKGAKTFALSETLKHLLLTGNARSNGQKGKSSGQKVISGEAPLAWSFIVLKNGDILSYPGEEKYTKICTPQTRSCYQAALNKDGVFWSKPFKCMVRNQTVISCSCRISGRNKNEQALIGMDINLEYMEKYLHKNPVPGMTKYIVSRDGDIIAASNFNYKNAKLNPQTNLITLRKFPFLKEFREATSIKNLQFKAKRNGRTYIMGMKHIVPINYYYIEQISEPDLKKEHLSHSH